MPGGLIGVNRERGGKMRAIRFCHRDGGQQIRDLAGAGNGVADPGGVHGGGFLARQHPPARRGERRPRRHPNMGVVIDNRADKPGRSIGQVPAAGPLFLLRGEGSEFFRR